MLLILLHTIPLMGVLFFFLLYVKRHNKNVLAPTLILFALLCAVQLCITFLITDLVNITFNYELFGQVVKIIVNTVSSDNRVLTLNVSITDIGEFKVILMPLLIASTLFLIGLLLYFLFNLALQIIIHLFKRKAYNYLSLEGLLLSSPFFIKSVSKLFADLDNVKRKFLIFMPASLFALIIVVFGCNLICSINDFLDTKVILKIILY